LVSILTAVTAATAATAACHILAQALKPNVFVSVPRLWNRIYDRVMQTMRESNPIKRRLFERAFAYKKAALEAGGWRQHITTSVLLCDRSPWGPWGV
jgi:long-subunit acyl-CoA synthetase (AMP-forming)